MFQRERRCPSCEATIGARTVSARPVFASIFIGLALTGCPDKDESETMGSEGSQTSPTAPTSMGDTETSSSESEGEDESSTMPGTSALYGTVDPDTDSTSAGTTGSSGGSESGNETATDTDDTAGSSGGSGGPTTGPSPLYGVAET